MQVEYPHAVTLFFTLLCYHSAIGQFPVGGDTTLNSLTTTFLGNAESIGAHTLWPGGSTGLNVDGTGLLAGIWEAGSAGVDTSHADLIDSASGFSKVKQVESGGLSSHATQVALKISSNGSLEPIGIAYNTRIIAFG